MVVFATPVSRQARRKHKRTAWKETVRNEALAARSSGATPVAEPVVVKIGYYYRGASLDLDNIFKAILDGLEHVVYTEDNLIADIVASKRSLEQFVRVDVSPALARALASGADFVHIVVERAGEAEVLR
jgi:Holliday junction resolvase RusA-like endonuclease